MSVYKNKIVFDKNGDYDSYFEIGNFKQPDKYRVVVNHVGYYKPWKKDDQQFDFNYSAIRWNRHSNKVRR